MTPNLLSEAQSAYQRGDYRGAESTIQRILSFEPGRVDAMVIQGLICARTGRKSEAIQHLEKAAKADPDCFEAHAALSTLLFGEGRFPEAMTHGERTLELQPRDVDLYRHFAANLARNGLLVPALSVLERALQVFPKDLKVHLDMAMMLSDAGRLPEATKAWERVLALDGRNLLALLKLGGMRLANGNFEGAIECGHQAVRLAPKSADAHILMALALAECARAKEAEPHLRRAIELKPDEFIAHAALGLSLQEQGKFEEARPHLERTLRLRPANGQAYYSLVRSRKAKPDDSEFLHKIEEMTSHPDADALDRSYMHYALGKAREDLGEYEASMRHYDQATTLAAQAWFGDRKPDHEWYLNMIGGTMETFTPEFLESLRKGGNPSDKPLLVVGMIRSGTTLVEQIVSSHPSVTAGGELTYWHDQAASFFRPQSHEVLEKPFREAASKYLKLLHEIGPKAQRVTDKMPHNYVMLGLVMAAFPNARVIHVRRNPLDNCLSIFTTAFNRPPEFALIRENIVFYYQQYLRMMEHWRQVLPADRLLEITYEDLIEDRETQTRRLVEFTGLAWDDSCLHHEKNVRSVNTPSVWQVRQPIYRTSVERWRRFEPWLGAFEQLRGI